MQEIVGDIWEQHKLGRWVIITTNGGIRKDGACVMGRGVAKQAADKFPNLPFKLGEALRTGGNKVNIFDYLNIITLPVKNHWREQANLELIEKSLQQLVAWANGPPQKHGKFYMVRPGCDNGRRNWETEVKPLCDKYLDDRFVVIEWKD